MSEQDKKSKNFLDKLKHNSPNKDMFESIKDFEEDVYGGKSFKTVRETLTKKEDKK